MLKPQDLKQQVTSTSRASIYEDAYVSIADRISALSYDDRIKVGSIIVKDGQILSQGWNGMPTGMPNKTRVDGVTKPEVIHSEANALMKLAKNGGGSNGATIYCTHSPCYNCALLLLQAGITRVVYKEEYCIKSIKFLKERGLEVVCIRTSNRIPTE